MHGRIAIALLCVHLAACGDDYRPLGGRSAALAFELCGTAGSPAECHPDVIAVGQAYPITIKVNDSKVFWGNYGDYDEASLYSGTEGAIYVAPKTGDNPPALVRDNIVGLTDIAVQGQDVYWTSLGPALFIPEVDDGIVGYDIVRRRHAIRNNRSGVFPSSVPLADTFGPSVGNHLLYFADYSGDRIMAVEIPARNGTVSAIKPWLNGEAKMLFENAGGPVDTATDDSHIAWVSNTSGEVWISKLGSTPERAASGQTTPITAPYAVALQGKYVYWIRNNFPGMEGQPGYLLRTEKEAPTGGSRTETTLAVMDFNTPEALAVDGDHVYWLTIDITGFGGRLLRTPVAGGETVILKDDLSFPTAIADDNNGVYVAECGITPGVGRILRFDKYSHRH